MKREVLFELLIQRLNSPPKTVYRGIKRHHLLEQNNIPLTTFVGSALNLAIPNIESEFDSGAAAMGWIIVAYILSVSAFEIGRAHV